MKNIVFFLAFICAIHAQNSIKGPSNGATKADDLIKFINPGELNPLDLPLKMTSGSIEMREDKNQKVSILTEGVHLWQVHEGKTVLDLYSESAVVWFSGENKAQNNQQTKELKNALIYAEGNVHFFWGNKRMRAEALFFDTKKQKGFVQKTVVRGTLEKTPLFFRARQLEIHSNSHIEAHDVDVSTCQHGEPHYHFSVGRFDLKQTTQGEEKKSYVESEENTLYAGETPIFYIPYVAGESIENFPLKSIRYGNSSRFGNHLLTTWGGNIFKSKESGLKFDWEFNFDIYQERSFGIGAGFAYEKNLSIEKEPDPTPYYGFFKTYYVYDQPLDQLGTDLDGDPLNEEEATFEQLYRFYWQHRHKLAYDWYLDIELSHISDADLLFDFFENEARQEKEQETYAHLKKVWKNHGATFLASANLNDFQEQVVFLPRGTYHLIKQHLFTDPLGGSLYYSTDVEIANVRREDDEENRGVFDGERIFRFDSIHTINYRFNLGPIQIVPFVEGRGTYFERGIDDNNIARIVGTTGVETATNFYRMFRVSNSLLSINQLFHIFTPQFRYQFTRTNVASDELIPFNAVEEVDDLQQFTLRLINRFKTIRRDRSVDFFLFEAELSYFPEDDGEFRDQLSNLELDLIWNIRENWSIRSNAEYNFVFDGIDILSTTLVAQPIPNILVGLDVRYERDENFIFTYNLGYDFSAKWGFEFGQQFDLEGNDLLRESQFTLRRIFHRFALDVTLEIDNIDDEVGVSFSFIPVDFGKSSLFVQKDQEFTNIYR